MNEAQTILFSFIFIFFGGLTSVGTFLLADHLHQQWRNSGGYIHLLREKEK